MRDDFKLILDQCGGRDDRNRCEQLARGEGVPKLDRDLLRYFRWRINAEFLALSRGVGIMEFLFLEVGSFIAQRCVFLHDFGAMLGAVRLGGESLPVWRGGFAA